MKQLMTISEKDYAKVEALAGIVKLLGSVRNKSLDDHGMTDVGWYS